MALIPAGHAIAAAAASVTSTLGTALFCNRHLTVPLLAVLLHAQLRHNSSISLSDTWSHFTSNPHKCCLGHVLHSLLLLLTCL
jgi:hypothetical protein